MTSSSSTSQWREHPNVKKTIDFPTWVVPSAKCQDVLRSKILKDHLGTVDCVHPRIRLVRSYSDTHQLILCKPELNSSEDLPEEARELLLSLDVELDGPKYPIELSHTNWTVTYILQQILPKEAHPPPTAFEQIGHVAHLNLRERHVPYAELIGQVLVENVANIETVVNKVGEVSGDFRTYDMQVLAGRNDTNVKLVESGIKLHFDLKDVYWCSRLSGERDYMMKHEFKKNQVICDPFCGVGAQVVQAASKLKCKIIANDWNPEAVAACKSNAIRNGVRKNFLKFSCQDAYEFLTDVGLSPNPLPHHVVMNFPLESPKFVSALRWWPAPSKKTDVVPNIHLYTFARDDIETGRRAEQVAIDMVAENLLPLGGAVEEAMNRQEELDELGCNVRTRIIRDVAPGKMVVCVSFKATKRLIKHIQGDFM